MRCSYGRKQQKVFKRRRSGNGGPRIRRHQGRGKGSRKRFSSAGASAGGEQNGAANLGCKQHFARRWCPRSREEGLKAKSTELDKAKAEVDELAEAVTQSQESCKAERQLTTAFKQETQDAQTAVAAWRTKSLVGEVRGGQRGVPKVYLSARTCKPAIQALGPAERVAQEVYFLRQ